MSKISTKERKKYLIRGISLITIGLILFGMNYFFNTSDDEIKISISDSIKFKTEYEKLNNEDTGSGKTFLELSIDDKNPIKYITGKEAIKVIKEGSGIIYFGFPKCPWCRNMIPVLFDAVKEKNINQVYYFNPINDRDEKELKKDGTINTTKEGSNEYQELLKLLDSYLPEYTGLNDSNIKRLYVPFVVFVQNGKIIDTHLSTLDSQTDPYIPLNDSQKLELKSIFINSINKVYNDECVGQC